MNIYETEKLVSEYLLFHYGTAEQILPSPEPACLLPIDALDFPSRCGQAFLNSYGFHPKQRALDLGCAVGRSTFELTQFFGEVVGIDFSQAFISAAETLKATGAHTIQRTEEGFFRTPQTVQVPSHLIRHRVRFLVGDAMNLSSSIGKFDWILMANLIDRLKNPQLCLEQIGSFLHSGASLVITSPYTWLEEFTPHENWLGARPESPINTLTALKEILGEEFIFNQKMDSPFLIREHARKFQWSLAEVTLWKKR